MMVGEPADKELRSLLDERVHLLIRINLVENSEKKNDELRRILAAHVVAINEQINRRRGEISLGWQTCSLTKINRL
jgi:hypothetical protein